MSGNKRTLILAVIDLILLAVILFSLRTAVITGFYQMNAHRYAFGTFHWPDVVTGHLMLVRL